MRQYKIKNLIGQKFSRLAVLEKINTIWPERIKWLCQCDCGVEKIILGQNLKNGSTKSCGCLHKEQVRKRFTTHGHRKSKTYESWDNMISRCTNPNNIRYHCYGGRGIKICKRWMKFENFLEDMGKVSNGHQIERINNDGNYCKVNCRWATPKEQARNRRTNRLIQFNGKTQCLIEWAEEFDIDYDVLRARLSYGWSIEKALTTPVRKRVLT